VALFVVFGVITLYAKNGKQDSFDQLHQKRKLVSYIIPLQRILDNVFIVNNGLQEVNLNVIIKHHQMVVDQKRQQNLSCGIVGVELVMSGF
jgi:hypothetical protein